jgi:hypothetical protein
MTIDFHTSVNYLAATPLGLLAECWKVEHRCSRCRQAVDPDQLIAHARRHEKEVAADS